MLTRRRRREKKYKYRVLYWDIDNPENINSSPWFDDKRDAENRQREIESVLRRWVTRGYGIKIEEVIEK
jgi:hypothetical protein